MTIWSGGEGVNIPQETGKIHINTGYGELVHEVIFHRINPRSASGE